MSDVEYVVGATTKLEARLRDELGATGRGLRSLYGSVSDRFENPGITAGYVDTISDERNDFVHNGRKNLKNPRRFSGAVRKLNRDITGAANRQNSTPFWQAFLPVLIFLLGLLFVFGAILTTN